MKRLYLFLFALGTMTLCSCDKGQLTPESDEENAAQGFKLVFQMSGINQLVLECVDGYPLTADGNSIITFTRDLEPGMEYTIGTIPCDLYGGYRLSIYRSGKVAHYFGVHQVIEANSFISPLDLIESELEFVDPDAPLVEEERPELDAKTKELVSTYRKNATEENKQALLEQMGIRYDKVVARKKAKLRELEREAKHQSLVDEMQAIVNEMVENREIRLEQQFLRLIDPHQDDNPNDEWMVLRGSSAKNAYIGYAPVRNREYAAFDSNCSFTAGQENYPVVDIALAQATAYCQWLSDTDSKHNYRLPTEEEWILGAGHMPKDVQMNSNRVESGLTAVDAYSQTTGACGGIDFWGNCWEWTTTQNADGKNIVKGGAWDSSRDECRTEYSDDVRDPSKGYSNVGFRVVRVNK